MAADMELAELADGAGTNGDGNAPRGARELEAVYDIPVTVSAVLGKATMQVSQLLKLGSWRCGRAGSQAGRGD